MSDKCIFNESDIANGVAHIASAICNRVSMHPHIVVPIMNGALMFAADLVRALHPNLDPEVRCIKVSRLPMATRPGKYIVDGHGSAFHSIGVIKDKRVLLIDTVFDTGETIFSVTKALEVREPRSITSAVMVWKNLPGAKGKPDFWGYNMNGDASFLYGYGLDRDNRARGLRAIYKV